MTLIDFHKNSSKLSQTDLFFCERCTRYKQVMMGVTYRKVAKINTVARIKACDK